MIGEVIMGFLMDFCPSLLTTKSKRSLQFSRSFRASLRLSRESMKDPLILVTTSPSLKSPSLSAIRDKSTLVSILPKLAARWRLKNQM